MTTREEALERIRSKCEQYWNESAVGEAEFHAILEFIHRQTDTLAAVEQAAPTHTDLMVSPESLEGYDGQVAPEKELKCLNVCHEDGDCASHNYQAHECPPGGGIDDIKRELDVSKQAFRLIKKDLADARAAIRELVKRLDQYEELSDLLAWPAVQAARGTTG